jgi:putative DNA primase/helicase
MDWKQYGEAVQREALRRAPAILQEWLPGGKIQGHYYLAASIRGGLGSSLKVNLEKNGIWKDWATGEGGSNLIALYAQIRSIGYKEACDELADRWKIERPTRQLRAVSTPNWQIITPVPEDAPVDDEGHPQVTFGAQEGEPTAWWPYYNADGELLGWRVRLEKPGERKQFRPLSFAQDPKTGATSWIRRALPNPHPLYGLEFLAAESNAPVLIVQGEKTADAARRLLPDWVVVTNASGDKFVGEKYTDWSPVINRTSRKVIWPDNDSSGVQAASQLAEILGYDVEIVRPDPSWRDAWDLADAEQEGWTTEKVLEYLESHVFRLEKPSQERRDVDISGTDLWEVSARIWQAIKDSNSATRPWLLNTPTGLVIVDRDLLQRARRAPATVDRLRWALTARFAFKHYHRGELRATRLTEEQLRNLIAHPNPPVPLLRRLTETPIATLSGMITSEGFTDGVYYLPHPCLSELVLPEPTPEAISQARDLIYDLLADFPFQDACDRAHAIAFALLPLIRLTFDGPAPMFRFEAPQARTGKTLLMRLLARIVCTEIAEIPPLRDEEEWRKQLTASLANEPDALLIDNVVELESTSLKKLLTDEIWSARLLGTSETIRVPVRCVIGCTINNPLISREILGRSLRIRLDAKTERPELRSGFRHPHILEYASQERAALVAALATLAAAGIQASESENTPMLGGFEGFCRRMSAVLNAIGVHGFLADRDDRSALSSDQEAFEAFVHRWGELYGTQKVAIATLLEVANEIEGLSLGRSDSDRARQTALAVLIRRWRGATIGGWQIDEPTRGRNTLWNLKAASDKRTASSPDDDNIPF